MVCLGFSVLFGCMLVLMRWCLFVCVRVCVCVGRQIQVRGRGSNSFGSTSFSWQGRRDPDNPRDLGPHPDRGQAAAGTSSEKHWTGTNERIQPSGWKRPLENGMWNVYARAVT